tara:strand:- start:298 stop:399 length:102 start_codon:yes stop_codon:yes gene_type:complete
MNGKNKTIVYAWFVLLASIVVGLAVLFIDLKNI